MSEFSAEFVLTVDRHWDMRFMHYETSEMSFNFEMWNLSDFLDMPYSLDLDEYEEFRLLTDGEYRVYVRGEAEYEPDVDWESGIDEGCFELSMDKISITKLGELENES